MYDGMYKMVENETCGMYNRMYGMYNSMYQERRFMRTFNTKDLQRRSKEILDAVDNGEEVQIIRGDTAYVLTFSEGIPTVHTSTTLDDVMVGIEEIKELLQADEEKDYDNINLEKNNSLATPKIEEPRGRRPAGTLYAKNVSKDGTPELNGSFGEQPCCASEVKQCRHWVWDSESGEAYVNTISGRRREAI